MEQVQPVQPVQTRKVVSHRKKTLKLSLNKLYPTNIIVNEDILEESIPVLYEIFNKYAPLSKITHTFRNFYIIGSGYGKLVLLMAKQHAFLKTFGIEYDSEKVVYANTALNKIRDDTLRKRIEFYCISPNDSTLNYNNACWVFLSLNTIDITEKLASELKSGCIIVSFKQLYNVNFKELNYVSLPNAISADSKVYIYTKI
jgi:hypothetical protein